MIEPFDVIIPVRNEEIKLSETAPALKAALTGLSANVIYALNDTTDNSDTIIRKNFGQEVQILKLPNPGKTHALRTADALAKHQLRVYLDADIVISSGIFPFLLGPLIDNTADLTAARLVADISQSHGAALRVNKVWADQLSRRHDAFMCCTALNANGLKQRGVWPDVIADDDWARNRIKPERRMIVETTKAYMSPPQNLRNWFKVRARWIRGSKQLKNLENNYRAANRVKPRGSVPDLSIYYFTHFCAQALALVQKNTLLYWGRDDSTRSQHFVE